LPSSTMAMRVWLSPTFTTISLDIMDRVGAYPSAHRPAQERPKRKQAVSWGWLERSGPPVPSVRRKREATAGGLDGSFAVRSADAPLRRCQCAQARIELVSIGFECGRRDAVEEYRFCIGGGTRRNRASAVQSDRSRHPSDNPRPTGFLRRPYDRTGEKGGQTRRSMRPNVFESGIPEAREGLLRAEEIS